LARLSIALCLSVSHTYSVLRVVEPVKELLLHLLPTVDGLGF